MPSDWWGPAVSQCWQITLLIPVAVSGVRWLARGRSHLAYGLLVVVLLKCVTPPVWSSRAGLFSWAERLVVADGETPADLEARQHGELTHQRPESPRNGAHFPLAVDQRDVGIRADREVAVAPADRETITTPAATSPDTSIDWRWLVGRTLTAVWLLGMCVLAGVLFREYRRLNRWCRSAEPAGEAIQQLTGRLARQMALPSTPAVLVTHEAVMPAAAGMWREVVLLPSRLIESDSPAELELVLAHELNHFRRWDTVVGSLQSLAQVLWWFHPLVWWLNRELRRYREQCCDEEVLARLECRPPEYARCLLNMLELNERFGPALGLAGMSPFEMTSQRLRNIMRSRAAFTAAMPRWCWLVLIGTALLVLPGAGLTLDANALPLVEGHDSRSDENAVSLRENDSAIFGTDLDEPAIIESPSARDGVAALKNLRYRWRAGEHLAYRVNIDIDLGDEIDAHSGTFTLSVRSVDEQGAEIVLGGSGLSSWRRPKPGRIPRPGRFSLPDIPRPSYGLSAERSVHVDALGRILTERGESKKLPGLLGSWPSCLLPVLPDRVTSEWTVRSEEILHVEADRFRPETFESRLGGPFRQPAVESLRATLHADYELSATGDGTFVITREYALETVEQVNGLPRMRMSGVRTVTCDAERCLPVSVTEQSELVIREGNVAATYPITVRCELLQPAVGSTVEAADAEQVATTAAVTYDGPAPVPSSDRPVTDETEMTAGDVVQVEWSGNWYPADVLTVEEDGRLRIHFRGFSDQWDVTVHRSRVQLPGPEFVSD